MPLLSKLEEDVYVSSVPVEHVHAVSDLEQVEHGQVRRPAAVLAVVPVLLQLRTAPTSLAVFVLHEGELVPAVSHPVHPVAIDFGPLAAAVVDRLYGALHILSFGT